MIRRARSIALIGMMGAGKSSVGQCLHRRTGLALHDTDEIVAARFGMSISEIFVRYGEQKFREAETAALRQMRTEEPKIIVTGGGIVLHKENIGILKKQAVIVWLDGNEEALFARAFRQQNRPLLRTKNPRVAFSQILTSRRPLYAKLANVRVDTSELTDEEIAVAILAKLEKMHCNPESPLPPKPS